MDKNQRTSQWWLETFQRFESSGLTKIAFCGSKNISKGHFLYHAKILRPDMVNQSTKFKNSQARNLIQEDKKFFPIFPDSKNNNSPQNYSLKLKLNNILMEFDRLPDPLWLCHFIKKLGLNEDGLKSSISN